MNRRECPQRRGRHRHRRCSGRLRQRSQRRAKRGHGSGAGRCGNRIPPHRFIRSSATQPTRSIARSRRNRSSLRYNNYYEFGVEKDDPVRNAGRLPIRPWEISIRRHGGKAVQDRLRYADQGDAAGRAGLSPPLRRDLGLCRAMVRLSDEGAGRFREADVGREICRDEILGEHRRCAGAESWSGCLGLIPKA